jgi:uroporphyrinogen-III synthase
LDTLPTKLIANGKKLREIVVYSTENQAIKIETPIDGVLFFSPSGVESFLEKNTLEDLPCFCIGSTTAAALHGITQNVHIASTPTVEAALQLSIDYFKR